MIIFKDATEQDVDLFLKIIRPMDREEVFVSLGEPIENYREHLKDAVAWVDTDTGELYALGGWDKTGDGCILWALLTDVVERNKLRFLRYSLKFRDEILKKYAFITNTVYARNTLHMEWLNWMGATWLRHEADFSTFIITRKEE